MAGRDFEKVLRKYLTMTNLAKNITKELQDMQVMYRHYPAGTRPFRSPYDLVELDEVWPAGTESDLVVGSTRKDAMEKEYYESIVKNKQILCEGILGHVEALKPKTTKEARVSSRRKYEASEGLVHLPLDPTIAAARDEKLLAAKADDLHAKIAIKLDDEMAADTPANEKEGCGSRRGTRR